jgi:hypothetical protein
MSPIWALKRRVSITSSSIDRWLIVYCSNFDLYDQV